MKKQNTILIADDDPTLRLVLSYLLEQEGFAVIQAVDGADCLHKAYEQHPDLVLLDVMMPNKDGREVCKRLREMSSVPIIMLTCRSEMEEKVNRLKEGADDYITKPFENQELIARISAVLRRVQSNAEFSLRTYDDGFLSVDLDACYITVGGKPIILSPKEWRLLEYFLRHRNQPLSSRDMLRFAWGEGFENEWNSLKPSISILRKKLHDSIRQPRYIHTEKDQGYRFETHDPNSAVSATRRSVSD
jgi:DNA-binding response OmpR family regulator